VRRVSRRGVVLVLAAALLLLVALTAWSCWRATVELRAARQSAAQLLQGLSAGSPPHDVEAAARQLLSHAQRADELMRQPAPSLLSHVPLVGRSVAAVRDVSAVADELAASTAPALVEASNTIGQRPLRQPGGGLRLDVLSELGDVAGSIADAAERADSRLDRTRRGGVLPIVRTRLEETSALVSRLAATSRVASDSVPVLSAMLGRAGVRRYLLTLHNGAEARGSGGGFLGSYGILTSDHGRLRLEALRGNGDLRRVGRPVLDLGADYAARYDAFRSRYDWFTANFTPHFPDAARTYLALYRSTTGQRLDGVIAIDTVALSKLLAVSGPVVLASGERVEGGPGFVTLLADGIYRRFTNDDLRDAFQTELGGAVATSLLKGGGGTTVLLDVLVHAARDGHLRLASAHDDEQGLLERLPFAGALPDHRGAYLQVVTNNLGQDKLDFYLRRELHYRYHDDGRVELDVVLRNTAPQQGLPSYVLGGEVPVGEAPGTISSLVSVFVGKDAQLLGSSGDGRDLPVSEGHERGHPVFDRRVSLPPGASRRWRLVYREAVSRELDLGQQGLVHDDVVDVQGIQIRR
jgi:hypothetical protein